MKLLMIALALFVLFSCRKETKTTNSDTIIVALDGCSDQPTESQVWQICFDSLLEDSRCPINANCIWQGVAKGKFRFKINSQEHVVLLSTLTMAPYYTNDTTVSGIHLKLNNILPYPVYPNNPQGQITASVEVTQ